MKLNLKLDEYSAFFGCRNIRLCADEVRSHFGIGEDVTEVTFTLSRRPFAKAMKLVARYDRTGCPIVTFQSGESQQILISTFCSLVRRLGIKMSGKDCWSSSLTPRVVYANITPK